MLSTLIIKSHFNCFFLMTAICPWEHSLKSWNDEMMTLCITHRILTRWFFLRPLDSTMDERSRRSHHSGEARWRIHPVYHRRFRYQQGFQNRNRFQAEPWRCVQSKCGIGPIHKSDPAPVPYPTMLHFGTECENIFLLQNGALWDICEMHYGILWDWPIICRCCMVIALQWRHNDHDGVSNYQPHGCLLNRLFRRRSKKTSKLRVTGLCVGNAPGPVNSPHKGPVTRKMFPFDDVIMDIPQSVTSCVLFIFRLFQAV